MKAEAQPRRGATMATLPVVPRDIDGPRSETGARARSGRDPSEGDIAGLDDKALVGSAVARGLTEERRNAVRQRALADVPWWYNPYGHLAGTTGIGMVVLVLSAVALAHLHVKWTDLLVVPGIVLFANWFEWHVHRRVLHKRWWPFEVVYDKHTPMHHMIYVEEDMALRSAQEFRLVLIPAMGVLGIVLTSAPIAVAVAYVWSAAAGWLLLLTGGLFMVAYELLHLCYHAPQESFIGRRRIIARLRAHHARHHDPRLMQRYNFNVTVPLFDWIMGTVAPPKDAP
jgi:hypothetical protein